jgi:hypothetical protein
MSIGVWRAAQINKIVYKSCTLQVALEVSSRPIAVVVGDGGNSSPIYDGGSAAGSALRPADTNSAARFDPRALGLVSKQHAVWIWRR